MSSSAINLFLASLSPGNRASILRRATVVQLPRGSVLYEDVSAPRYAYCLLTGLASVVTAMSTGDSAEVAFIGHEGVVGSLHLLGPATLPTRCFMQLPGSAYRIPFSEMQTAFQNSSELRNRILEHVQEQAAVVAQIAGCNRLHTTEERLIRWFLMAQDRTGYDTLDFTHEYLSGMIATRRSTVTMIAGDLQKRGLIQYSRGTIHILNRPGLEAATCACYPIIKRLLAGLYQNRAVSNTA